MSYPDEKMSLFIDRSVSECIEATFDFMRINRRIWLRSAIALMAGACIVFSLLFKSDTDGDTYSLFDFYNFGNVLRGGFTTIFFLLLGGWLAFIHCYSLLIAYREQGSDLNTFTQRQMLPYYLSVARRTWWFVILLAVLVTLGGILGGILFLIMLLFVMVPLAHLPSVYLFEYEEVGSSVKRSFKLGYSGWFQMAVTIFVTAIVGMMMTAVVQVPALLFNWLFTTMAFSVDQLPFPSIIVPIFTIAPICFGILVTMSMVLMGAAFQYGTATERVDEASLDTDIEMFENL